MKKYTVFLPVLALLTAAAFIGLTGYDNPNVLPKPTLRFLRQANKVVQSLQLNL
jgi:hypothetical protein